MQPLSPSQEDEDVVSARPAVPNAIVPPLFTARVCLLFLAQMVFGFGWSLYLVTPKYFAVVLGAGPKTIGGLAAAGGFAAVLSVPLTALGLDRLGRRPFFQFGSALLVVVSLSFLFVDRVGPLAYFAQGLIGAAFVLAFNGIATLVADLAPPSRLGHAIGVAGAANLSMNAVAAVVAEGVANRYGWSAVFRIGIVAGCMAVLLSFFVRETSKVERGAGGDADAHPVAFAPLVPILATSILAGAGFTALFTFHQPYALLLGKKDVQSFFVGFTALAVASRVVFGGIGDRYGRRRVSAAAAFVYALSAACMIHMNPNLLLFYGALFGAAHGVLYPTLNALALALVGPSWRGRVMTLYNGAFNLGSAVSGLAWGALALWSGYASVFVGATVTSLIAVATLLVGQSSSPRASPARQD